MNNKKNHYFEKKLTQIGVKARAQIVRMAPPGAVRDPRVLGKGAVRRLELANGQPEPHVDVVAGEHVLRRAKGQLLEVGEGAGRRLRDGGGVGAAEEREAGHGEELHACNFFFILGREDRT